MSDQHIEQLIEQLKTARAVPEIARFTACLLQACGVWNMQSVGHELMRHHVTNQIGGLRG
jgi:hypothetical protein